MRFEVAAERFDGLVLPGGCVGADKLRADEKVVAFGREFFAQRKPVGVICHGLWTGQRMSDCLKAKWSDLEVGRIKVRQDKRGARIMIPAGRVLSALIETLPRTDADTILTNSLGREWTVDGYQSSYSKTFARASILSGIHFHDLRGTAITRMALAGCTAIQIATVTGHAPKTVDTILANHCLGGQAELAEQAILRLETGFAAAGLG